MAGPNSASTSSARRRRRARALAAATGLLLGAGCVPPDSDPATAADAARTLVVINDESEDSRLVGAYYAQRRGIPFANVVRVHLRPVDEVDATVFYDDLLVPVRA